MPETNVKYEATTL